MLSLDSFWKPFLPFFRDIVILPLPLHNKQKAMLMTTPLAPPQSKMAALEEGLTSTDTEDITALQDPNIIDISEEQNAQLISLTKELDSYLDLENTLSSPAPSINLSPFECHALQLEEVEVLRAIFDNDITSLNDDFSCFFIKIKFLSDVINEDDVIRIWFSLPPNYPCIPPIFEIESNQSGSFTFAEADELFDKLMQIAMATIGRTMVYDLITYAQDYMQELIKKKKDHLLALSTVTAETVTTETKQPVTAGNAYKGSGMQTDEHHKEEVMEQEHYHPRMFVGSLADVICKMPPSVQIIRIENILRQDLAKRFQQRHKSFVDRMWQGERKHPQLYNLKPQLAFHGTLSESLPSIVQHGLVIPDKKYGIKVRCGSSLGLGIYLSPDPTFSLGYTGGSSRLIVCAVLLGKIYKHGNYSASGFNSIISESELEWVIFDAAQVLPCYVIQVMVTNDVSSTTKKFNPPPLVSIIPEDDSDLNDKEKKMKLLVRAQKYLPFGYGPGKTVILEAAEIDDDEEDYGDYQLLRYENESHVAQEEESELQDYRYKNNKFLNI